MLEQLATFFDRDPKRRKDYQNFARRYRKNPAQLSDEEVLRRYRELMAHVDDEDDETRQAYEETFAKVSSRERRALAEHYREATRDTHSLYQGFIEGQDSDQASSPRELGRMTRKAAQQDPELLEQLVGPNSPLSGTGGRTVLARLAVSTAKRLLGSS